MGMMDLRKEESSPEKGVNEDKKCCVDCRTTKTPLWRGGPAGPKSLCNACGIRYRKKRISVVRLSKGTQRKREKTHSHAAAATNRNANSAGTTNTNTSRTTSSSDDSGTGGRDLSGFLKARLMALGKEVILQRTPSVVKKQRCQRRRKLGEEEQAAFDLLALSCGSVFA